MRRTALFGPALLLLILVWLVARVDAVPLYDGLGLPQEPYRYLQPPPGQPSGLPPGSIHHPLIVAGGNSPIYKVSTGESPPQAYFIMQYRALKIPTGVTKIIITGKAVPPPAPAPAGSKIDGNVYRFTVTTSSGAPLALRGGPKVGVELRGTGTPGTPTLAQYTGGQWVKLPTLVLLGENYYLTNIHSLGDFTLLLPAKGASGSSSGLGGALPLIIAAVVLVLLAVAAILLIRLTRRRAAAT